MAKIPEIVGSAGQWPFLRWAQESIVALQSSADRRAQAELNANKSQNATLGLTARQVAELIDQQAALATQTAYLASLKTRSASAAMIYNVSPVAGDGVTRYYDTSASVTMDIPTGRALVTVSTGLTFLKPGNLWAEFGLTFNVSSPGFPKWFSDGNVSGRLYSALSSQLAVPTFASRAIDVSPTLPNTFVLSYSTASGSTTTQAEGRFETPHITVQALDPI